MRTFPELWNRLQVEETKRLNIKRDWTEGKVPDLPFEIIDQKNIKEHIQGKLENIFDRTMTTSILQAQYGDGKTNVFKYLELYFSSHLENNIRFIYCRANPDQTDLCLFLLQHIQNSLMKELREQINVLSKESSEKIALLASNFKDDFAAIREYTLALFNPNNHDNIDNLIYLGTGRLYSKGMFGKFNLERLTDFNRREVFVLFMNILASADIRIVFAIDELEKINDKSSKRMAYFLTSYRELCDLFNKIEGHYLMTAVTNGVDIEGLCPPLYGRVNKDIIKLHKLEKEEDVVQLVKLMADLLDKSIDEGIAKDIVGKLRKKNDLNNRLMIQLISEYLKSSGTEQIASYEELLNKNIELSQLFKETEQKLKDDNAFANLSRAFFDPLNYYLTALGYTMNSNYRRDYQAVVDDDMHKAFFFLFNDDTKIKDRIVEFSEKKDIHDFVVFAKYNMDVSYAQLQIPSNNIKIVEYDPEKLFILLNMYRWNFDKQEKISVILSAATKNVF